jgi:UTP--glucose-1-phosphate uridylyltransferase
VRIDSSVELSGLVAFCSGEAEQIEWSKIQTPTDEVVVPYDTLASPPEGMIAHSDLILVKCSVVVVAGGSDRGSFTHFV